MLHATCFIEIGDGAVPAMAWSQVNAHIQCHVNSSFPSEVFTDSGSTGGPFTFVGVPSWCSWIAMLVAARMSKATVSGPGSRPAQVHTYDSTAQSLVRDICKADLEVFFENRQKSTFLQ